MDEHGSALKAWEAFYVIVGSSAGALTGLQFVVLTLITEGGTIRGSGETLAAFGSPNVVHFCAALLISAVMSAPWANLGTPGVGMAACGVAGFVYSIIVLRRAMSQKDYKPVLEDWIWHAALPLLAYAALMHAGVALSHEQPDTLYVVGAAALLLVFIGIHNAWDTVTYVMFERAKEQRAAAARERVASLAGATEPVSDAAGTPGASAVSTTPPATSDPPPR
jgi:hypothetical protein